MKDILGCGIYRITNLINGKSYIGQSLYMDKRMKKHIRTGETLIHKAILKYGIDKFRFEVLEFCEPYQLNELETYWILYYNTNVYNENGYGYNRNNGGDGHGGKSWCKGLTKETDERIRKRAEKTSKGKTGKHLSESHKNNIKIATEGKHATYGMLGKQQSEHQKKTLSEKLSGREFSEEHLQKLRKPKSHTEKMGRCHIGEHWYHKEDDEILINNNEIEYYISIGYIKGRKIKKL